MFPNSKILNFFIDIGKYGVLYNHQGIPNKLQLTDNK